MSYRVRSTGEVHSQGDIRKLNPNVSAPRVWTSEICDVFGIDPVLTSPQPDPSAAYKVVYKDGAEQDANGNWVEKYSERDMFADTTVDGVTTTKSEHEVDYQAQLDADTAARVRLARDNLLSEVDWMGASDLTMSSAMTTYRQALRDITGLTDEDGNAKFPNNLADSDWPTKP